MLSRIDDKKVLQTNRQTDRQTEKPISKELALSLIKATQPQTTHK